MQPKRIVLIARDAADAKQAVEPVILDISRLTSVAHYFLITHGNTDRHVRAIAENIQVELETKGLSPWHFEGAGEGRWIVVDYGSVIAHVFHREMRQFYGLERLWGNAPRLK